MNITTAGVVTATKSTPSESYTCHKEVGTDTVICNKDTSALSGDGLTIFLVASALLIWCLAAVAIWTMGD